MPVRSCFTAAIVVAALALVGFALANVLCDARDHTPPIANRPVDQETMVPRNPPVNRDAPGPRTPSGVTGGDRLQPADFTYEGAFRLPDDFNWGALGLTFHPDGNSGTGSLLVTGFELPSDPDHPGESCWDPSWDCYAFYGEVTIPTPAEEANWENLPQATLTGGLIPFDGGLASTVNREYVYVSDIEYVPQRGSQTSDKLYGSINLWYAEGAVGEDTFPTVWMANLDGTDAQGMFHVGPVATPFHGRKMGCYLFTTPTWYADQYLGGRTLVTGRARGTPVGSEPVTTRGGSQGPTLFAFHVFDTDDPTGNLDALPVLYYRVKFPGCAGPNVGDPDECDYPGYTMCDDWTGGAFVDNGAKQAIMLLGYKGLGDNCYDEPPVECDDPCDDSHGYHCNPYERQVIFYDVHELGSSALGQQDPWVVLPYTIWRPDEFYIGDNPCQNMGGMAFDARSRRLFMVERGLGEGEMNAVVVHVWSLPPGPDCDLDNDGDVDIDDFAIFADCLTGPDVPPAPQCTAADFDGDSDVDLADFATFQPAFTAPGGSAELVPGRAGSAV